MYPDFDQPFRLDCYASKHTIGSVSSQREWNHERVVTYASKSLNASKRNWIMYDRERWAILGAIRCFHPYLAGRKFTVVTDHKPLVGSANNDPGMDPTRRRARWAIELSTYDFDLLHRDGSKNTNADALIRVPVTTVNTVQFNSSTTPTLYNSKGGLSRRRK